MKNVIEFVLIMLVLMTFASAECLPVFFGLSALTAVFGYLTYKMSTKEE